MSILLRRSIIWSANKLPPQDQYNMFGFDGTDDYIDFGNDASLQLTDNFTICVWIETSSLDSNDHVFGKWSSTNNQRSYFLQERNDGRFRFVVSKNGGATTYDVLGSTSSISANTEYFVCCTVEGTTLKIFVDGVEYASDTSMPSAGIHNSTENLVVGGTATNSVDYEGSAANFFVFNRVLSDSEILNLYNSGNIPYYETLPTSLTSGNVLASELSSRDDSANDLSGNGNNGTKNGGVSANGSLQTFASYS